MKTLFKAITLFLIIGLTLAFSAPSYAAGTEEDEVKTPESDWHGFVQMDIDSSYYESAMERLETVRANNEESSADWNNYMGYTLRKQETPDLAAAETHYQKALALKADHRGAMEYYGELKLLQEDLAGAQKLLASLQKACPEGCDELEELDASIKEYTE